MTLDDKVRDHFKHDALKHGLNGDEDIEVYLDRKIDALPNTELLMYIGLALGDLDDTD